MGHVFLGNRAVVEDANLRACSAANRVVAAADAEVRSLVRPVHADEPADHGVERFAGFILGRERDGHLAAGLQRHGDANVVCGGRVVPSAAKAGIRGSRRRAVQRDRPVVRTRRRVAVWALVKLGLVEIVSAGTTLHVHEFTP